MIEYTQKQNAVIENIINSGYHVWGIKEGVDGIVYAIATKVIIKYYPAGESYGFYLEKNGRIKLFSNYTIFVNTQKEREKDARRFMKNCDIKGTVKLMKV